MIITIAGLPGSGKSTTAKAIAQKFNLKHYSVGDYRREMATKRGITINELNKLGETDFSTDKEADDWQKSLAKEDDFVIDGRLSFFFIPDSIKVFLKVTAEEAGRRIFKEKRENETFKDLNDAIENIKTRQSSDIKRYKKYYKINPFEEKQYDIVVDTENLSIEEGNKKVIEEIKKLH